MKVSEQWTDLMKGLFEERNHIGGTKVSWPRAITWIKKKRFQKENQRDREALGPLAMKTEKESCTLEPGNLRHTPYTTRLSTVQGAGVYYSFTLRG